MGKYCCYILKSIKDNSFYIGITGNLKRRVVLHNAGRVKYTSTKTPFELIYYEEFGTLSEAYRREKQIKSWKKRKAIESLINK